MQAAKHRMEILDLGLDGANGRSLERNKKTAAVRSTGRLQSQSYKERWEGVISAAEERRGW